MKTLQVNVRGRRDPLYVNCDRYEVEEKTVDDLTEEWLVVYRDDREIGRYRLNEVVGYHEYA